MEFKFCPFCSELLLERFQHGRLRLYCNACDLFHYRNPIVGVAVLLLKEDGLLLVKRVGSYEGKWCIPCGYVEWNEDVRVSAQREVEEETGLVVTIGPVFNVHSNFHDMEKQTVGIWFWGREIGGTLQAGSDAAEASYFSLDLLPEHMAFPTDMMICEELRSYLENNHIPEF
ncbi:MAG: NUDIX domain-containing protein [Thermodesulfobacteriota bacterium]|nr:NUDIX domain-containing protein [Thermodesulfobacteriota bacterium]